MKKIILLLSIASLFSCTGNFDFKFNPVFTLNTLKKVIGSEPTSDLDMLFEGKATCFYLNQTGIKFLRNKLNNTTSNIEIIGDLSNGLQLYQLEAINKHSKDLIAKIDITCHYTHDYKKWCSISDLYFVNGQHYPANEVCHN